MSFSQLNNVSLSQIVSEKNVLKKKIINKDKVLNSETFASFKLIEYVGGNNETVAGITSLYKER